jgi:DNA-binding GntR family transcriptional regulator
MAIKRILMGLLFALTLFFVRHQAEEVDDMTRASDTLIVQIKQDIFSGALRPGDQLEESELAARFGVSRTPIREAIRSMVNCGLLETRPRKGAIVRKLSAKELHDLFQVAAELEGMACRLACETLTQPHLEAIKTALASCRDAATAQDIPIYAQANLAFHAAIHATCGNSWLIDQLQQIEARINVYRLMPYEVVGRLEESMREHTEIYNAITKRRGMDANNLMRDHMMLQGMRLPQLLKALED